MDKVEGRLEVDSNHGVPLLLSHAEHEAVLGDAGVVYQDVDRTEVLLYFVYHLGSLFKVGCV